MVDLGMLDCRAHARCASKVLSKQQGEKRTFFVILSCPDKMKSCYSKTKDDD